MRRFLSSELRLWHLLVAVVMLATLSGGFVLARTPSPLDHKQPKVGAVRPLSFFGAGEMRMTATSKNDDLTIAPADGNVEMLHVTFTVASHHHADIAAFFNAEAYKNGLGYCYLEFHLDTLVSTPIPPGQLWVADGYVYNGAYPTINAQGFQTSVGPGTHRLYATLLATTSDCHVYDRSLILIANRR